MNLTEWARQQGVHPQTAYWWFREGTLPVPAVRINSRSVLVSPDDDTDDAYLRAYKDNGDTDAWAAGVLPPALRVVADG